MLAVCGAALCENVEGSFLCLCASDLEEYDAQEGHCRPRGAAGEHAPGPTQPFRTTILQLLRGSLGQDWGSVGRGSVAGGCGMSPSFSLSIACL